MLLVTIGAWFALAGIVVALLGSKRIPAVVVPTRRMTRADVLPILVLALMTAACYGWLARSYFLADDFILLRQAHGPLNWRAVFTTPGGDGFFRPLGYISYLVSAKWAGSDPGAWHSIGFVLHAANACLLYLVAAALGYSRFLAWVAAALFVVHGSHPEAALWVAGRFDLLSTFFVLFALLALLRSRAPGLTGRIWLAVALAAMIAGLLTKESAYSFVLVAALLLVCIGEHRNGKAAWSIIWFGAVTAALFGYRWYLLAGIGGYGPISVISSLKALFFRMWGVLFFPINWTLPSSFWLLALAIVYCAALARLFRARPVLGALAFALGFVILTAAPAVSQLLIGADLEKSRVLYLPSAGFCLLIAAQAAPLATRSQILIAAGLLAFHATALVHNLRGWEKASATVQATCAVASKCATAGGAFPQVSGLPRTLNGVYTFANGFPQCVAMQTPSISLTTTGTHVCRFVWDPSTASLRSVQ
ncbi:MAG TPA: hypothetical protein VKX49_07675 [Bryobacteraceae bacterium]|nr:hypothetical protein [Bryobacteraceae bacterium]